MNNTVLVLAGPTAVGKTSLSIKLAKELNGEIISADSMQIYKKLDIGSAKIKKEEMEGIPHYMIDIVDPKENFSVSDYREIASPLIDDILKRGKLPIIAGGTGLYINALTCNMEFTEAKNDLEYREKLNRLAEEKGNLYLHEMLKEIDEVSYNKIHPNNLKRVIRALEVYKLTGKPFSSFDKGDSIYNSKYNVKYYVLNMDREKLYNRINKRVDIMIEEGLVKECESLKEEGCTEEMTSMQGIGYKEMFFYLNGKLSLEDSIELIKKGSRNYAKRQLTWFRRDNRAIFMDKDILSEEEILNKIVDDIK